VHFRLLLVVVAAAFPAAATPAPASEAGKTIDPKGLVLQFGDLPSGFERTSRRYVSNRQANSESSVKKDYSQLGRITGYEAVFTKEAVLGILQVTSAASTYRTAAGARRSLAISARATEASREVRFRRLSLSGRLGDEAFLWKTTQTRDGTKIDVFLLAWRSGRIYAGLLAAALAGSADPASAAASSPA